MELSVQEFRGLLIETIARWRSLHKDLRFGQFLSCAIGDRDLFLIEDDEMERLVREKFEEFEFEVADQKVEYGKRFIRRDRIRIFQDNLIEMVKILRDEPSEILSNHCEYRFEKLVNEIVGGRDLPSLTDEEIDRMVREKTVLDGLPHDLRDGGSEPKDGNEEE